MKQPKNRADDRMIWGYSYCNLFEDGIYLPIKLSMGSHPHALITGSSGSGKSQAVLFTLGRMLQKLEKMGLNADLYFCDFKYSMDYQFLEDSFYPHYYEGLDCYDGIMEYYHNFAETRTQKGQDKMQHHFLIIDEYQALITYYTMKDKQNKTKYSSELLSAIAEILMMGRNTQSGVWHLWVVTQVASATLFANGTRENFMVTLAMGNLSKEQKGMIFPGQELPDRRFKPGQGMLLADGYEIKEVIFPLIRDSEHWKKGMVNLLLTRDTAPAL